MDDSSSTRTVLNETEARQGVTGNNVRYVLIWGTLLAIIALIGIFFAFV